MKLSIPEDDVNAAQENALATIRLRPRELIEMRAGDVVPHPLNARLHPESQKAAVVQSLKEFGDVRSLLCYRSPAGGKFPGQVVNIDGHLRASIDPDRRVMVELLTDLTDEEAEALLIVIDPLAALATYDENLLNELRHVRQSGSGTVQQLWASLDEAANATHAALTAAITASVKRQQDGEDGEEGTAAGGKGGKRGIKKGGAGDEPERHLVVVYCSDEKDQTALFRKLKKEGRSCELKTC
jgi:hypothetical protein